MRVFFIGVCGTAMGNAAVLLKKMGHEVAGSDADVYPPMSDVLAEAGIELFEGFSEESLLGWNPDRVVIGNAVSRGNPQVENLLNKRNIPFVSLPQLIGEDLIGNRPSIVVAGTHGKTTTTALTSYCLSKSGLKPGFLIGGVPLDLPAGNELGELSSPFVIEGDEYDSAFFDKRSKFIHYRPRILILNNLEFDHGDIFRDLEDISRSFSHLLRIVPGNGFVLQNGDDPNLLNLSDAPWTQVISIGLDKGNDLRIVNFEENRRGSRFDLVWRNGSTRRVESGMCGLFNARNLAMSVMASSLMYSIDQGEREGLDHPMAVLPAIDFSKCSGVKRRQEILLDSENLTVLSDFAHHPTAIEGALESLRARWPDREIVACFEPRSNTAVTNVFQERFAQSLSLADHVLVGEVHRAERLSDDERIDTGFIQSYIEKEGKTAVVFQTNQELSNYLTQNLQNERKRNRLIVFFSNGSFGGAMQEVTQFLKASTNPYEL